MLNFSFIRVSSCLELIILKQYSRLSVTTSISFISNGKLLAKAQLIRRSIDPVELNANNATFFITNELIKVNFQNKAGPSFIKCN